MQTSEFILDLVKNDIEEAMPNYKFVLKNTQGYPRSDIVYSVNTLTKESSVGDNSTNTNENLKYKLIPITMDEIPAEIPHKTRHSIMEPSSPVLSGFSDCCTFRKIKNIFFVAIFNNRHGVFALVFFF